MGIPWSAPAFDADEERLVLETLHSGWLTMGPRVREFEAGLAETLDVAHAVAVGSGTAALDVALAALGIGPGDEVIVPAFTYVATANAVVFQGARPVMVDVEPETLNMDPAAVAAAIGPRTKAILPIDYGGCLAAYAALEPLAERHGLALLQDAAHSLGAREHATGRQPGGFGVGAILSLHVSKLISTVEGGMFVTNDPSLAARARMYRNQGESPNAKYEFVVVGRNHRLSDLHASLGVAQLRKLPHLLARRREVAGWYRERFDGCDVVRLLPEPRDADHPYFLFSVLYRDRAARDRAAATLAAAGIETRVCWPRPVYRQPAYAARPDAQFDCPVAEAAGDRVLSLPVHHALSRDDVGRIAAAATRTG